MVKESKVSTVVIFSLSYKRILKGVLYCKPVILIRRSYPGLLQPFFHLYVFVLIQRPRVNIETQVRIQRILSILKNSETKILAILTFTIT